MPIGVRTTHRARSANHPDCEGAYALQFHGVRINFGEFVALAGINLTVDAGERRAILGVNGAGKTTLLNLVNGDLTPTAGDICFFGENITALPPHERVRRGLRRTYQISLLFHGLSVFDNVYLASRGVSHNRYSLLRPRYDDRAMSETRRILKLVRLETVADRLVAELSHGRQRQLEIGMALVGGPRLILFDEPAAGLSPHERSLLVEILSELPSTLGYLLIEHDLEIALNVVSRVTMMHNGKVFKEGSPSEIEQDHDVQELYLGVTHEK